MLRPLECPSATDETVALQRPDVSAERSGSVPEAAARVQAIGRLYADAEGALRAWCAGRG